MDIADTFKKISRLVENNQNFVLLSHIHTDGDALGSLVGLKHFLTDTGKNCTILVPGEIPEKYAYLNTERLINHENEQKQKHLIAAAQVIFILDISHLRRLEKYYDPVKLSPAIKILIDHHPVQSEWAQIALIDTQRIATAELIYDFLKFQSAEFTRSIAQALYTAILSDSGSFRFFKTSASTFRMAADLIESGAEPSQMYSRVFETARAGQIRAWGKLLANLKQAGNCSWITISRKFMISENLSLHEIDGLIDIMRRNDSPSIFAVFVEKERDEILVSLRSKGKIDVGRIARSFGGGGHFHAAGFTSTSDFEQTIEQTLAEFSALE